jgi:F420-dependent oxidoreductase-like protein
MFREKGTQMQIFEGQIRFGIHSGPQNTTFADYLALWKKAEEVGLDWASVFDHFIPMRPADPSGPCFEGLTLLSAMAAHTTRLRCGILVVGNTYRNPAVLANIAATIDHVSGGRMELGIGAGWYEMEHDEYGIPFHSVGRRIRMLGETAKIVKSLWTQERTDFDGRYYKITNASCEPKPVQQPSIPLWVGGAGEKMTLRVVAESADGWNTFFLPMPAYKAKLDALAAHCRDVGRDPASIRKSLVLGAVVGETEAEVRDEVAKAGGNLEAIRAGAVVGTPEQCAEQVLEYVRAGVGDFILRARPPANVRQLELFAQKVAPLVRAEARTVGSRT